MQTVASSTRMASLIPSHNARTGWGAQHLSGGSSFDSVRGQRREHVQGGCGGASNGISLILEAVSMAIRAAVDTPDQRHGQCAPLVSGACGGQGGTVREPVQGTVER